MKKALLVLLSLLIVASMLLTSCSVLDSSDAKQQSAQSGQSSSNGETNTGGNNNDNSNQNNNENHNNNTPTIPTTPPAGYQFYTEGNLRFAYPEHWVTDADGDLYDNTEESDARITLSRGEDAALLQDITAEQYQTILSPVIESEQGMEVFNETAEKKQNSLGTSINVITVNITYFSVTMRQVTYATTINNTPYTITLTTAELDATLEETVFESIVNLNPQTTTPPQDPNAPEGYQTVTNYNLRFAIPTSWTPSKDLPAKDVEFSGNLAHLSLQSDAKDTTYAELTTQSFIDTMVPGLEAEMDGTISNALVEHKTNDQGLLVTVISYQLYSEGITGWQYCYAVTIDNSTHLLFLTLLADDATLRTNIFQSFTAVSGPNAA